MPVISIDIPDAAIADLARALALRQAESPDAAVKAIAAKVNAGQTTTAAEKRALLVAFLRGEARQALADLRAQEAAQVARDADAAGW